MEFTRYQLLRIHVTGRHKRCVSATDAQARPADALARSENHIPSRVKALMALVRAFARPHTRSTQASGIVNPPNATPKSRSPTSYECHALPFGCVMS